MKDRIYKGEVRVKYFPNHLMLVDYLTKTFIREMVKDLQFVHMGYKSILSLDTIILSSIKEPVGNNLKYSDWA